MRIRNRTKALAWYHFQWPRTTRNPDFKVTQLFDAEYLRNGTTCIRVVTMDYFNRDLHAPYSRVSFRMTLSDLAKYWPKIAIFSYPLHSTPLLGVPRRSIATPFGTIKLQCCDYPKMKKSYDMFSRFDRILACDGQTYGRIDILR